ncbi:hypothetical protein BKA69DRAFT_400352 [Paraphysoderma sedebokerense]|nr:hypothetical protein BKA69DRAFT_400352 [Paraphysoderma sedebokerense]
MSLVRFRLVGFCRFFVYGLFGFIPGWFCLNLVNEVTDSRWVIVAFGGVVLIWGIKIDAVKIESNLVRLMLIVFESGIQFVNFESR